MRRILSELRSKHPLVHCITNYVTANDCANLLLAAGAVPVMADAPEETAEIMADDLNGMLTQYLRANQ